jgi:hypothetical protein
LAVVVGFGQEGFAVALAELAAVDHVDRLGRGGRAGGRCARGRCGCDAAGAPTLRRSR